MVIFEKASDYWAKCTDDRAKIAAIDKVVEALLIASTNAADTGHLQEYWLDDGQSKIRCRYSGPQSVANAILAFERLRNYYSARIGGRRIKLVDESNFNGRGRYF